MRYKEYLPTKAGTYGGDGHDWLEHCQAYIMFLFGWLPAWIQAIVCFFIVNIFNWLVSPVYLIYYMFFREHERYEDY